jgi:hypothetical protein
MNKFLPYILAFITSLAEARGFSDSGRVALSKPALETSWYLFTAGYRVPVIQSSIINSGHGLYFEAGLNPGYLLSKKTVLGVFVGWAWKDGLWNTAFNREFLADYNTAIEGSDRSLAGTDSAVIFASKELFDSKKGRSVTMPGCEMNSFHNYALYYGIMVRLPVKYLPAVKLYAGSTRSHYQGPGQRGTGGDYTIFELRRALYGCELILFRGVKDLTRGQTQQRPVHRNIGMLSIYYERCDFYNASLYFTDGANRTDIRLRTFTSHSFLQKYRTEASIGLKISFCIM